MLYTHVIEKKPYVQHLADKFSLELRYHLGFLLKAKSGSRVLGIQLYEREGMLKTMDEDLRENNLAG